MTKKLHLDLAGLRVESFAAAEDAPVRGTVAGNEFTETCNIVHTCNGTCDVYVPTCNNVNSCYQTACTCGPDCTGEIC